MKTAFLCLLMLTSLAAGSVCAAPDPLEAAKIQHLIASVETLAGAQFLRNGTAHDAREAADHLRRKLAAAGDWVKSADDFIRLCGSRSSISGERYRIRLADGTLVEAEAFFRERLRAFAPDRP
jgi:hypothetical protein